MFAIIIKISEWGSECGGGYGEADEHSLCVFVLKTKSVFLFDSCLFVSNFGASISILFSSITGWSAGRSACSDEEIQ